MITLIEISIILTVSTILFLLLNINKIEEISEETKKLTNEKLFKKKNNNRAATTS